MKSKALSVPGPGTMSEPIGTGHENWSKAVIRKPRSIERRKKMAMDCFLKIGDVKGESQDHKHKDEIDVLAWSWGMTQSASTHVGGGGGSGKVSVQDLNVTKYIDKATPNLIKFCSSGKHFKEALLTIRKAGDKPVEYIKLKMTDVLVSSIGTGGHGSEDRLTENLTLNFSKFEVTYTPQKADGSADAEVIGKWNIATNTED
jgi:type VI secretion system secreted protein Hcp